MKTIVNEKGNHEFPCFFTFGLYWFATSLHNMHAYTCVYRYVHMCISLYMCRLRSMGDQVSRLPLFIVKSQNIPNGAPRWYPCGGLVDMQSQHAALIGLPHVGLWALGLGA